MIKVTDLHKSFGELAVLKGIDFQHWQRLSLGFCRLIREKLL